MQRIIKYSIYGTLLTTLGIAQELQEFTDLIQKDIEDGWQPLGGLSLIKTVPDGVGPAAQVFQVLVKYAPDQEPEPAQGARRLQ